MVDNNTDIRQSYSERLFLFCTELPTKLLSFLDQLDTTRSEFKFENRIYL